MAKFDAHFTALSAAAAGSNVVQESLAAATTTQYSAILSKLETLEALYIAPGGGGGPPLSGHEVIPTLVFILPGSNRV